MDYNNKKQIYFDLIKEYQSNPTEVRMNKMIQYTENNFTVEERVAFKEEYYGLQ